MTSPIATADDIARSFTNLFSTLRASMIQQLWAMWFGLDDYRDKSMITFLDSSVPLVEAARDTSATATTTYLSLQLEALGLDFEDIPMEIPVIRGGIPLDEIYSRPFKDVWTGLSKGKELQDAITDGADRLRQLVETDIQLTHTHTSRNILSGRKGVEGFRRVPTGAKTCALCLVASTQRYRSFDLMPIHPGCDCRVAPITSEHSVSQVVDPERLNQIHEAIEKQFGMSSKDARKIDYRKILLQEEHGEYGPVLVVAKHNFTGPKDLS